MLAFIRMLMRAPPPNRHPLPRAHSIKYLRCDKAGRPIVYDVSGRLCVAVLNKLFKVAARH